MEWKAGNVQNSFLKGLQSNVGNYVPASLAFVSG